MEEILKNPSRLKRSVIIGLFVAAMWALVVCLVTAMAPPGVNAANFIPNADGVLLFGVRIGNINRYWDPFVFGFLAGLVTRFWVVIPPVTTKRSHQNEWPVMGFATFFTLMVLLGADLSHFAQSFDCSGWFVTCLVLITITPFGIRCASVSTTLCASIFFITYGSVPATFFIILVYFGKWISWWSVNIFRHGWMGSLRILKSADGTVAQS